MTEIKINLENLSEDERKTLMALAEKGNKTKVWKPKDGDTYWLINQSCKAVQTIFDKWDYFDQLRFDIGNCFRTQKEAEEAVEYLKVQTKWKRLSIEAGEDENPWRGCGMHWAVIYNTADNSIKCSEACVVSTERIYFPSKESLKAAIEEIGEDNVKKYILGIKE